MKAILDLIKDVTVLGAARAFPGSWMGGEAAPPARSVHSAEHVPRQPNRQVLPLHLSIEA
jgi:hypothetical protein